jgi:pimeloyl-ACP methyl ester carboxylesterase
MANSLLVFLHGFGEDARIWDDFVPNFSWPYSYVCPNYAEWTDCYRISDYAQKLLAKLPEDASLIIVGHSMGGYIALAMAELFPDRIERVILLHSTASADSEEKKNQREKTKSFLQVHGVRSFLGPFVSNLFAPAFVHSNPLLMRELSDRYVHLPAEALIAATEAMKQRPDAWDFLEKTALPFLFILGDEDALIPHEAILRGLEGKAKHKCVILNHVGHQGTYEAPNACFQAMANFI